MAGCKYTFVLSNTEETNETLVAKKVIRVLDCQNNITQNELCNLWNFSHCPNDDDYCQPFIKGDIIYKQLFIPKNYFKYMFVHVIDMETGEDSPALTAATTSEKGFDSNENEFRNLIINTTDPGTTKCFYIKIVGYTCDFKGDDLTAFNSCVSDLQADGYTLKQAQEICLSSMCSDGQEIIYSEPYCLVACQNTIEIKGFYPNYDCNGNFYGAFASGSATNSFVPRMRIFGVVEPADFLVEETVVNKKRKAAKKIKTVNLMSKKIPFYVVEQLANIFASQVVTVEGEEYLGAVSLSKNNDEGMMWIIKTTLQQECDTINFSCDN